MSFLLWLPLLMCIISTVHCARFLAVLPFPGKSHSILHYSLFHQLTQRGHQVVVYGCFPPPSHANLTFVEVCGFKADTWTYEEFIQYTTQALFNGGALNLWYVGRLEMENTFKNDNIKKLLQSKERFDLVFVEATFAQESIVVFGHKFQAPVINLQGFSTWTAVNWITGNPLSVAHIPNNRIHYGFTNKMYFTERAINAFTTVNALLVYHFSHLPKCEKLLQTYYKDPSTPPLSDMLRDMSLTLVNSHLTMEYPRPYTPNVIPIGGAHLPYHNTPLPQDIKTFLDQANEGVIFFSLGSFVPAHGMPKEKLEAFINSFRELPQKVLWKINAQSLPNLSNNVILTEWVPQPTVLAHPNCVLFITHGGLFSQHEALHAGVPVVGVPFFADQSYNVGYYEHLGVGVKLDFATVSQDSVLKAITTVIGSASYRENAKRVSAIVRDKPVSPAETAVFWVEYVLRHNGARHLRPASADLPWYQLLLLDLVAVILAAALVTLLALYQLVKGLIRVCSKTNVSHTKKNS